MPYYYFVLLAIIYVARFFGYGPTWSLFDTVLAPCETHGWTNFLFINNFYPNDYTSREATCLPWTWFIAVYMQLSIVLPFLLYLICHFPVIFTTIHIILCLSSLAAQGLLIGILKTGINPAYDF